MGGVVIILERKSILQETLLASITVVTFADDSCFYELVSHMKRRKDSPESSAVDAKWQRDNPESLTQDSRIVLTAELKSAFDQSSKTNSFPKTAVASGTSPSSSSTFQKSPARIQHEDVLRGGGRSETQHSMLLRLAALKGPDLTLDDVSAFEVLCDLGKAVLADQIERAAGRSLSAISEILLEVVNVDRLPTPPKRRRRTAKQSVSVSVGEVVSRACAGDKSVGSELGMQCFDEVVGRLSSPGAFEGCAVGRKPISAEYALQQMGPFAKRANVKFEEVIPVVDFWHINAAPIFGSSPALDSAVKRFHSFLRLWPHVDEWCDPMYVMVQPTAVAPHAPAVAALQDIPMVVAGPEGHSGLSAAPAAAPDGWGGAWANVWTCSTWDDACIASQHLRSVNLPGAGGAINLRVCRFRTGVANFVCV